MGSEEKKLVASNSPRKSVPEWDKLMSFFIFAFLFLFLFEWEKLICFFAFALCLTSLEPSDTGDHEWWCDQQILPSRMSTTELNMIKCVRGEIHIIIIIITRHE